MKKIDENAIIGRVKELREQFAGARGRSEFARSLGISPSTYNYYENNRVPPIETLLGICELTGADLWWLLTGESGEKNGAGGGFGGRNALLLRRIDALLGQRPELGSSVGAFIEILCAKSGFEDMEPAIGNVDSGSERAGWIPVLGRTAAGVVHLWADSQVPGGERAVTELDELVKKHIGSDIISSKGSEVNLDLVRSGAFEKDSAGRVSLVQVAGEGEEVVEFVESRAISEKFADCFALRIDGDSMSPQINDGDIVIVSPSIAAAAGQAAIAKVAGQIGVTCKLFRVAGENVHLIPVNEKYETKVVAQKDMLWALAVLCHVRV